MNTWLLAGVAVVYLGVAWGYLRKGQVGMCLAFAAYAVSNVGFILAGMEEGQ